MNNCWIEGEELTAESVESVIAHDVDDDALGEVIFTPFGCEGLSNPDFVLTKPAIYPNPSNGSFIIEIPEPATTEIFNISGQRVLQAQLAAGSNDILVDLPSGVYILKTNMHSEIYNSKIVIE